MDVRRWCLAALLLCSAGVARGDWRLTFDEEFNSFSVRSTEAGTNRWEPFDFHADRFYGDNHEMQYYVDSSRKEEAGANPLSVKDGVLRITARPAPAGVQTHGQPYISGEITTAHGFSQRYGFFQMRAKLPKGAGLWPAFWLIPADGSWPPEIDIFEVLGDKPNEIHQTVHSGGGDLPHKANSFCFRGKVDSSDGFHTYGVLWDHASVRFYVDGVETAKRANVSDVPMYILINLAVGGKGSWPGPVTDPAIFPAVMAVDWVRVYSSDGSAAEVKPQKGYAQDLPKDLAADEQSRDAAEQ